MKAALPILLLCAASHCLSADLGGDWAGTLLYPQGSLSIVLHVTGSEDVLNAVADSPDQNQFGMPVDSIRLSGNSVMFSMAALKAQFSGTLSNDQIKGSFVQGAQFPVTLIRVRTGPGCSITQAKLVRLSRAELDSKQSYYFHERGIVFDDANCQAEAQDNFRRSAEALGKGPNQEGDPLLLTDTRGMLQLEKAKQLNSAGRTGRAVQLAWDVVRTNRTENAQPRAVDFLASILPPQDQAGWTELEGYIEQVGDGIQESRKLFLLETHAFQKDGPTAIAAIEAEEEETSDPQRRFALQILLVRFYSRLGLARDAELLLTSMERDAGETLVDWNMRRAYLETGANVWKERARSDPGSASRAAAYAQLLTEFNSRMGRYF